MSGSERVAWPPLHARVELFGQWEDQWLKSIVEDRDGPELRLAVPNVPGSIVPVVAHIGDLLTVRWINGRGAATVDCRVELIDRGVLASWQVHALGDPVVSQRRSYVRVRVRMPLQLLPVGGEGPVAGWVDDLSEGGVAAFTGVGAADVGCPVEVRLELGGVPLTLVGHVLRVEPAGDQHRVVVEFADLGRRDADRIRRFVFDAQRRSLVRQS